MSNPTLTNLNNALISFLRALINCLPEPIITFGNHLLYWGSYLLIAFYCLLFFSLLWWTGWILYYPVRYGLWPFLYYPLRWFIITPFSWLTKPKKEDKTKPTVESQPPTEPEPEKDEKETLPLTSESETDTA